MNQHIEYDTERLQDLCVQNATDSISFIEFLLVSSENQWSDYSDSANFIIKLFDTFSYGQLIQNISVSPSSIEGKSNILEYTVMYDIENSIYVSITIMYDLNQKFIMVDFCEYNAKIADRKEQEAYYLQNLMGPFFIDHPINNQEFSEKFKFTCYRILYFIKKNIS